jgi:sec-independent protein translocase protein TatA
MSDDEKAGKSSQDADFTAKSIADKQDDAKKKTLNATTKSRCNSCSILVLVSCCWSL